MMERRIFLGSLLGLGPVDLVSNWAPVDPDGELPSREVISKLGKGRPEDESYWERIRDLFYLPDEITYLNNGSLGLSPRLVVEAMYKHMIESESARARKYPEYPWWGYGPTLEIRRKVAAFIGAEADEIALTRNATEGMNTVATGLDLNQGDEVLMTDQEHPGGRSAWYLRAKRYGIVVREFEVPRPPSSTAEILNRFESALTARTRVVSVSQITTVTGGMLPVKEICAVARSRNIVSLVDGAHAIGQLPLDMHDMGCDYFAASPHKWLYAPKGTGILYCRRGMTERLWCHTASGTWDKPELGCERLSNIGTSNYSLLVGMVAAMEFQERIGKDLVADRGRYLNRHMRSLLGNLKGTWFMNGPPPDLSTAMIKAMLPLKKLGGLPGQMWEKHRIWLATAEGDEKLPASIRFSLPVYVLKRDLDRAVSLLQDELRKVKSA